MRAYVGTTSTLTFKSWIFPFQTAIWGVSSALSVLWWGLWQFWPTLIAYIPVASTSSHYIDCTSRHVQSPSIATKTKKPKCVQDLRYAIFFKQKHLFRTLLYAFGRYCLFLSGGIVIGTKSSDTSAPAPKLYQHQRVSRFNVEPDEERLVVGLELDLEQGGVHPQGENVLRWNYWLVITHNVIPRKSMKIRFTSTITCVARGKPSSSSSRRELTWRWIIIKLSLSLSLTYSAAPSSSQSLPSWSHCHRC